MYGALKRSAKKAKGGAKLSTVEAAVLGSGASLAAQAVTTPLDVVRTRVMTASPDDEEYEGVTRHPLFFVVCTAVYPGLFGTPPAVVAEELSRALVRVNPSEGQTT